MSFLRRQRPAAWSPDMPPRPRGTFTDGAFSPTTPGDWPRLNPHGFPIDRGYMTGGIDHPEHDPCGAPHPPLTTGGSE